MVDKLSGCRMSLSLAGTRAVFPSCNTQIVLHRGLCALQHCCAALMSRADDDFVLSDLVEVVVRVGCHQ